MTGPADWRDQLPHYGLRTTGRIDLGKSNMPFYRTGDGNFDDEVRAQWLDQAAGAGYAYKLYERDVGSGNLSPEQKQERQSRFRGALEGESNPVNGSCP